MGAHTFPKRWWRDRAFRYPLLLVSHNQGIQLVGDKGALPKFPGSVSVTVVTPRPPVGLVPAGGRTHSCAPFILSRFLSINCVFGCFFVVVVVVFRYCCLFVCLFFVVVVFVVVLFLYVIFSILGLWNFIEIMYSDTESVLRANC